MPSSGRGPCPAVTPGPEPFQGLQSCCEATAPVPLSSLEHGVVFGSSLAGEGPFFRRYRFGWGVGLSS